MKRIVACILTTLLVLSMTACASGSTSNSSGGSSSSQNQQQVNSASQGTGTTTTDTALAKDDMFTSRDKEIGYDESSATKLVLANETVTITKEGVYILSGEIADGQIIVEVADTDKVRIADGIFDTTSGKDGIQVDNAEDTAKGFFYMANGSLTINPTDDGVNASGTVQIENGTFTLKAVTMPCTPTKRCLLRMAALTYPIATRALRVCRLP